MFTLLFEDFWLIQSDFYNTIFYYTFYPEYLLLIKNNIIAGFILILAGLFGILKNNSKFLILLMCLEIILLGVNLSFINISAFLNDFNGQIFALFILTIAAAESAIGLALALSLRMQSIKKSQDPSFTFKFIHNS